MLTDGIRKQMFYELCVKMSAPCRKVDLIGTPWDNDICALTKVLNPGELTVFAGAIYANLMALLVAGAYAYSFYPALFIDLLELDNFCVKCLLNKEASLLSGVGYYSCDSNIARRAVDSLIHKPIVVKSDLGDIKSIVDAVHRVWRVKGGMSMLMINGINALSADADVIPMLRQLAKDLDIPILVTYKICNDINTRKNHRPTIDDLPTEIGRGADTLVMISAPWHYLNLCSYRAIRRYNIYRPRTINMWIHRFWPMSTKRLRLILDANYQAVRYMYQPIPGARRV